MFSHGFRVLPIRCVLLGQSQLIARILHVHCYFLLHCAVVLGLVSQSCPTLCDHMDFTFQAPLEGILQARILERLPVPSPGDLPNLGIEPRSPALQADSLPAEPPERPKNTGVSSLSFLQGNFLAQESNHSLLHSRWTLQGELPRKPCYTDDSHFCTASSQLPLVTG